MHQAKRWILKGLENSVKIQLNFIVHFLKNVIKTWYLKQVIGRFLKKIIKYRASEPETASQTVSVMVLQLQH